MRRVVVTGLGRTEREFSERDRDVLDLVRPGLEDALRGAETRARLVRAFAANDYLFGQRNFQTPNEPNGMVIQYHLRAESSTPAAITIANASGQEAARLSGTSKAGINTVVWSTRDRGDAEGAGARAGAGGAARQAGPGVDTLAQ